MESVVFSSTSHFPDVFLGRLQVVCSLYNNLRACNVEPFRQNNLSLYTIGGNPFLMLVVSRGILCNLFSIPHFTSIWIINSYSFNSFPFGCSLKKLC